MREFEKLRYNSRGYTTKSKKLMERYMKLIRKHLLIPVLALTLTFACGFSVKAQNTFEVLTEAEKAKVVPTSFYFAGQNAPTQIRNAAAARIGTDRFIVAV